jgi:spore coat polysaccharide biosynthesis predicted glycosyltransferase SpsG
VPLAVLQDDDRHAVCADLFVNGNLYGPDLDYEFVGDPPKRCLGTDYVCLRSEIRARVTDEPPWREQPKRAIVMMGGSDTAGLTPTVVQAFDGFDLRVDAIVGPGCTTEQEQEVRRVATECSADIRIARDPDDLVERMVQADVGVSTASSATYEHLGLGIPLVSIPVVDNQEPIAAALRSRDAAIVLREDDGEEAFRTAIEMYLTDTGLRRRRRRLGRELVDGCGVERLFAEVFSIVEGHPRS